MMYRFTYLAKTIFVAICLAVGCSSSGTMGCGSSSDGAPTVDSDLLGIYQISRYQRDQEGCDQLMDVADPGRLVLYSIASTGDPKEAILVGQFCSSVDDCRARVKDFPTLANYSFFEGSDATGWKGWGIANRGMAGDQCLFEVQEHSLTSTVDRAITIDTRQVETEFMPTVPEGSTTATCTDRDAIASINDDSPCKALFLLEATFETSL
jgi:hypothetical protein